MVYVRNRPLWLKCHDKEWLKQSENVGVSLYQLHMCGAVGKIAEDKKKTFQSFNSN